MSHCNRSSYCRRMGVFIVASCDVARHLNSVRMLRVIFLHSIPRDGCLCLVGISGVQEHDGTISRRENATAGNASRHFHYKDGRFWVDKAARMPLEYVCEILVKGAAWPRTRNIFIRPPISTVPWQIRKPFPRTFSWIWKIANVEIWRLFSISRYSNRVMNNA